MGEWQFTGNITAKDKTIVSPQVGSNYGYSWFNISNEPVVIRLPHQKSPIENAIPTNGVGFYGLFRVYEPVKNLKFPVIKNTSKKDK